MENSVEEKTVIPRPVNPSSHPKVTRRLVFIQSLLGMAAYVVLALPYVRLVRGLGCLRSDQRYLFVCNHISLLDTILLGALCWRSRFYPILVLGDKHVWHASWLKRVLSGPIGFLLERGKFNSNRVHELQAFAGASKEFHLVVFPEGTRGDGIHVAPCQPGIYYVAQEARVPIVPVFFANMQMVSSKGGRFHPFTGLRRVEVHFGQPITPEYYLSMRRDEFLDFVLRSIVSAQPTRAEAHLSPFLPPV